MNQNKNKTLRYPYELSYRKDFTPKQKRGANACIFWIARRRSHALFTALNWSCQMKKKPGTYHSELKSRIWFKNHWKSDGINLYQERKWRLGSFWQNRRCCKAEAAHRLLLAYPVLATHLSLCLQICIL